VGVPGPVQFVVPVDEVSTQVWFGVSVFVGEPDTASVTTTTMAAVSDIPLVPVLVYIPVSSEGVTSSPGLELGSLIVVVRDPPPGPVKQRGLLGEHGPGGISAPLVVLIEQTVLSTVDTKLPLLCAQAADDPNKTNATKARLVIIEQFFMILLFSCCFRPALVRTVS